MTLSIMTLSVKGLFATYCLNDTQHNNTAILLISHFIYCEAEYHYPMCRHADCRNGECHYPQCHGANYVVRLIYTNKTVYKIGP